MRNYFIQFKKTKVYQMLLKYILMPFYSIFWHYLLNLLDKILLILYNLFTNRVEYLKFYNNTKILLEDKKNFKYIANEINKSLPKELIENSIEKIKSDSYKVQLKEDFKNEAHAQNPFTIDIFDQLSDECKSKIINFASSDYIIKTAANYLGVFPILARIHLNLNIPTNKKPSASQLWHRDDFGYKNLDFFIAVSEIDKTNGPLKVLKKRDPFKIFLRINNEINSKLTGERGKIKDENFFNIFGKEIDTLSFEGKSGTAIALDSIRNYHKGGFCLEKNRIVLRINFMTNDSTYNLENLSKQRFQWYNLLDEKNKKKFFIKKTFRERNKIFRILRIPQLLFKFYHMISLKI